MNEVVIRTPIKYRWRSGVHSCLIVVAALSGYPSVAADWSFDPRIELSGLYDDNYRLTEQPGEEIKVAGGAVDALLRASVRGSRAYLDFTPRVRATAFPGDSSEEAVDGFAYLRTGFGGERTAFDVDVSFAREELLKGYLPTTQIETDLGQPSRGDQIGRLADVDQDQFRVAPTFSFEAGQRSRVTIDAEYLDVGYDPQTVDYSDYRNIWGALGYTLKLSATNDIGVRLTAAEFDPTRSLLDSANSYGLIGDWMHTVSETAVAYVTAGVVNSELRYAGPLGGSDEETLFVGGAGVRWAFEASEVFLDVTSNVEPNPAGTIVQRDQLRGRYARRFTPVVSGFVGLRYIADNSIVGQSARFARDDRYLGGDVGVEWRVSRQVAVVCNYDYVRRELSRPSENADSNGFRVSVVYEPRRPAADALIRIGL